MVRHKSWEAQRLVPRMSAQRRLTLSVVYDHDNNSCLTPTDKILELNPQLAIVPNHDYVRSIRIQSLS